MAYLSSLLVVLLGCAPSTPPPPTAGEPASRTTEGAFPTSTFAPTAMPVEAPLQGETPAAPAASAPLVETQPAERGAVRAIILFIGDGMGQGQRTAARWFAAGQNGTLAMERLPVSGFAQTASADNDVTDSAAAGTALASGVRTDNGMVGMGPDGAVLPTILELAQGQGWSVGLVTTVQMAHATPAVFAAHVPDRQNMPEIAQQMLSLGVDVLLGGGEDEFLPFSEQGCYPDSGERSDGLNLLREAQEAGYTYVCESSDLEAVDPAGTGRLLGLFADEALPRPFSPSLALLTRVAIDILSQDAEGFFLMVEAGQIDWAAHDNQAEGAIESTLGLDAAVAVAQVYAAQQPDTLLIVTGDHETGGMRVDAQASGSSGEDGPFSTPDGAVFYVNWEHGHHTSADVPVSAQGPWSELLSGSYPNTHIFEVMYAALVGSYER